MLGGLYPMWTLPRICTGIINEALCWETMWDDLWVVTDELEHAPEAGTTLLDPDVGSVPLCISHCGGLRNDMLDFGTSAGKTLQSPWLVT